jgi:hypothetical protein
MGHYVVHVRVFPPLQKKHHRNNRAGKSSHTKYSSDNGTRDGTATLWRWIDLWGTTSRRTLRKSTVDRLRRKAIRSRTSSRGHNGSLIGARGLRRLRRWGCSWFQVDVAVEG